MLMSENRYLPQHELLSFFTKQNIHLMAHQPLGGKPVAVVNPNADRPGPLEDPTVSHVSQENLLIATSEGSRIYENGPQRPRPRQTRSAFNISTYSLMDRFIQSQPNLRSLQLKSYYLGPFNEAHPSCQRQYESRAWRKTDS